MDFNKFSGFILLIGMAALLYGVLGYLNIIHMFESPDGGVTSAEYHALLAYGRKSAVPWLIGGGITAFVGFAIKSSSKKN